MAFNPLNDRHISKLREAARWSRKELQSFRENRKRALDLYVGPHYGLSNRSQETPFNILELAVNIFTRRLASSNPRALVTTTVRSLQPTAYELSLALNYVIRKINLGESLAEFAKDAVFSMGILKVGITPVEFGDAGGFLHESGVPFCDPIGLEDWVHDMRATRWEQIDFAGNLYRMSYEELMDSGLLDPKTKDQLKQRGEDDSTDIDEDDDRPSKLSQGSSTGKSEYRRMIELWDYWLPADKLLVTLPADGVGDKPLRIVEWTGPERGPYHRLGLERVPGNIMPLAPVMLWIDLVTLVNRLCVKAGEQADRQKTITAAPNRLAKDLEAVVDTSDGQTITTDGDPAQIRQFTFGGVDPNTMAALNQFRDLFSYVAGNLDMLGGLGAQSPTLGQDELLKSSASEKIADLQDKMAVATKSVIEDLAFYLWNDPFSNIPLTKEVTPTLSVPFTWDSNRRDGEFFQYNFDVEPFSLQGRSPTQKLNLLGGLLNQYVLPLMQMWQEQGYSIDAPSLLKILATYSNLPELEQILVRDSGPQQVQRDAPGMPPVTTRNYVRRNVPSGVTQQPGGNGDAKAWLAAASAQPPMQQGQA